MRDVIVLAIIAAFFALCLADVRWCDHIIGPDPDVGRDAAGDDDAHRALVVAPEGSALGGVETVGTGRS